MNDKKFDEYIKIVQEHFDAWLDKNDNLLEVPVKESIGNAYFDGYEMGQKDLVLKLAVFLQNSLTFEDPVELAKKLMTRG